MKEENAPALSSIPPLDVYNAALNKADLGYAVLTTSLDGGDKPPQPPPVQKGDGHNDDLGNMLQGKPQRGTPTGLGDSNTDATDYDDDEEDEDLNEFVPTWPATRESMGLKKYDLRMEGYIKFSRREVYLMAVGPRNSVTYRLAKAGDVTGFYDREKPDLRAGRYGEMMDPGNPKKFRYRVEATGIKSVAWFADPNLLKAFPDEFPRDEDLLKPRRTSLDYPIISRDEKKGTVTRMKAVECLVHILWKIDGKDCSSWETRTTARRIWGKEKGDKAIYETAQKREVMYAEWAVYKRNGRDVTASPFRDLTPLRTTPEVETAHAFGKVKKNSKKDETLRKNETSKKEKSSEEAKKAFEEFSADYCTLLLKKPLEDLTPEENIAMMTAWKGAKVAWLG
jgi:hypothetical protein